MSDSADLPSPELDPFDAPEPGVPQASPPRTGLAPIFYRADAHREYYRFLFAGIVMTLGCLMPFGPEWEQAGYKTLSGALFLVISLGVVWSMWIAIYGGRFRMNWIMFALLTFVVQLINVIFAAKEPAVLAYIQEGKPMVEGWREWFRTMFDNTDPLRGEKVGNFARAYGMGRIVLFAGSALNVLFLLSAVFGGARAAKAQKQAARASAAERRSSRS